MVEYRWKVFQSFFDFSPDKKIKLARTGASKKIMLKSIDIKK